MEQIRGRIAIDPRDGIRVTQGYPEACDDRFFIMTFDDMYSVERHIAACEEILRQMRELHKVYLGTNRKVTVNVEPES